MANVNYIVNSELKIPRIIMELEPEDGGTPVLIEIEDIKKFYTILSSSALEEYL
jgi:hypothetical protein